MHAGLFTSKCTHIEKDRSLPLETDWWTPAWFHMANGGDVLRNLDIIVRYMRDRVSGGLSSFINAVENVI